MNLWAISDLHIGNRLNREALDSLRSFGDDWLILAGDVGETEAHLRYALAILTRRFSHLLWTPGNHDLWTQRRNPDATIDLSLEPPRGEAKYGRLVEICREYGVTTPEDAYPEWPGELPEGSGRCLLAPLFTLYDYSFRPPEIEQGEAVAWAAATRVMATDELLLHSDPYPSKAAWCEERCRWTEVRLEEASRDATLVLINHFPLREDLVRLWRIPRFSIWCGTRRTDDWHRRFRALKVIYGHLHIRGTKIRDGVPFEEVSLGYPRQWDPRRGLEPYLRKIF